jgi:uncharacterized membrane protein YeaQ/YmgE (transglycosylase-associated protein family)
MGWFAGACFRWRKMAILDASQYPPTGRH